MKSEVDKIVDAQLLDFMNQTHPYEALFAAPLWIYFLAISLLCLASFNLYIRRKDKLYLVSSIGFLLNGIGNTFWIFGLYPNIGSIFVSETGLLIAGVCFFIASVKK